MCAHAHVWEGWLTASDLKESKDEIILLASYDLVSNVIYYHSCHILWVTLIQCIRGIHENSLGGILNASFLFF